MHPTGGVYVVPPAGAVDLAAWWGALDEWQDWLGAQGMSAETREQYDSALVRFFRRTRTTPEVLTEGDVVRYLRRIDPRGSAAQLYVRALKSYYRWATRPQVQVHDHNPVVDLRVRARKYLPPDFYTEEEYARIVASAARRSERRAWTILLLLETGARIGSLAEVRAGDVGTEPGQFIHFRVAKGDRPYRVPLSPSAAHAVRELLAYQGPKPRDALVGVHKVTIWRWFHEAAVDAGFPPGRRHPHLARHTAATNLYGRTRDPLLVKTFLNHADLSLIHRYAALVDDDLRRALSVDSFSTGGHARQGAE